MHSGGCKNGPHLFVGKGLILEDAARRGASMRARRWAPGAMGIYSFQATAQAVGEGAWNVPDSRVPWRAAAFGHYEDPEICADSRYGAMRVRANASHASVRAAVARQQLRGLDERNALIAANVRALNQRLCQLPGLTEPRCRPDQHRGYYYGNMLMFDQGKAGVSRGALIEALKAEGVRASYWDYPEQHKLAIYSEAKWWHHAPAIPAALPGTEQVNRGHIFLPQFCGEASELNEQYGKAFEKVWANRRKLAKS